MMRVLVCGGRDFDDYDLLNKTLHELPTQIAVIIHGGARGADSLADRWAVTNWLPIERYLAKWDQYGKPAGAIRNGVMLKEGKPDLVIAFPGGRGTANMVTIAKASGVEVREIKQEDG